MKKIMIFLLLISCTTFANTRVVMKTNLGDIEIKLFDKKSPVTVKNFLNYVNNKFYDGTIFHRVYSDFVIQGGGYDKNLVLKKSSGNIKNEANNEISNETGTISMARLTGKDTASNQFFINVRDNKHLDHKGLSDKTFGYAVFGRVEKGMSVVNRIKQVRTTRNGRLTKVPVEPIVIQQVYVKKDK